MTCTGNTPKKPNKNVANAQSSQHLEEKYLGAPNAHVQNKSNVASSPALIILMARPSSLTRLQMSTETASDDRPK
jgi:hypothetical protein